MKNLLMLEMLLPILVGASHIINNRSHFVYILTCVVNLFVCIASVLLCLHVFQFGEMHYYFGGWLPPAGIEFKITKLNSVFVCFISLIATSTFLHGKNVMFDEIDSKKINTFCSVFLICFSGFIGVLLTNDFFNLYVFIEISSLASYALISISRNKSSIKSAFCYLIIGSLAATCILIGIAYIYSVSGTLNMDDFISKFHAIKETGAVRIGYCFILAGILVKSGLFPLHTWLVDSYRTTNAFILPFLNGTSSKIFIFLAIKMTYVVFGVQYSFHYLNTSFLLCTMGILAIVVGSFAAFYQVSLRSMLVFSAIAQIGYSFIALGLGTKASAATSIVFLLSNILAKSSMFMLAANIFLNRRSYDVSKLFNLKSYMPVTVVLFAINGASVVGLPMTVGFIAKISLIIELLHKDMWVMLAIVLGASIISILYIWKFLEAFLYSKAGSISDAKRKKIIGTYSEKNMKFSLSVILCLTAVNLLCGLFFDSFAEFVNDLIFIR